MGAPRRGIKAPDEGQRRNGEDETWGSLAENKNQRWRQSGTEESERDREAQRERDSEDMAGDVNLITRA